MKKIYYEKVGRRYVPVSEYDNDFLDALPKGNHLIMSYPGGLSRRYNIDPNYAAMIAACRVAEDAMCRAIQKASELRPQRTPLTDGQRKAWQKLAKEFGDDLATLQAGSARDVAEAGLQAMQEEADKLLQNPSVRKAYERFQLICELTKEGNQNV
jgi:predicted alpha-1,6-mannanase (GH76 family)